MKPVFARSKQKKIVQGVGSVTWEQVPEASIEAMLLNFKLIGQCLRGDWVDFVHNYEQRQNPVKGYCEGKQCAFEDEGLLICIRDVYALNWKQQRGHPMCWTRAPPGKSDQVFLTMEQSDKILGESTSTSLGLDCPSAIKATTIPVFVPIFPNSRGSEDHGAGDGSPFSKCSNAIEDYEADIAKKVKRYTAQGKQDPKAEAGPDQELYARMQEECANAQGEAVAQESVGAGNEINNKGLGDPLQLLVAAIKAYVVTMVSTMLGVFGKDQASDLFIQQRLMMHFFEQAWGFAGPHIGGDKIEGAGVFRGDQYKDTTLPFALFPGLGMIPMISSFVSEKFNNALNLAGDRGVSTNQQDMAKLRG